MAFVSTLKRKKIKLKIKKSNVTHIQGEIAIW